MTTIANAYIALRFDHHGRIVGLRNRKTRTELITHRQAAEAWRLVLRTGRHTVAFLLGSAQKLPRLQSCRMRDSVTLTFSYSSLRLGRRRLPIKARFCVTLENDGPALTFHSEIDNDSEFPVDEVEFPMVGGMGGFPEGRRRVMNLIFAQHRGRFYGDVLADGLPAIGGEGDQFCRALETSMFPCGGFPNRVGNSMERDGAWMELWSEKQGLYAGLHAERQELFALKLEKYPKEVPHRAPGHAYPKSTPRWIRFTGLYMPRIPQGGRWRSEPLVLVAHRGDWHEGADRFSAYRHRGMVTATPPAWLRDFVGWTEILGKTYLGEVFHTYHQCADEVIRDARKTGLRFVFYYGHTKLGAEGGDFDHGPAEDLGGERGFRDMVRRLHQHDIRIMLLDHFHRYVNHEAPEYRALNLERFARRDIHGNLCLSRWPKETGLSCIHLAGPTPEWVDMCPACEGWQEIYLRHVTRMIELGVDGLELDLYWAFPCYSADHGHAVGQDLFQTKLAFMRQVREHARKLNPDFALFAEDMVPENREVFDGFYSNGRYGDESDRIFRYMFPELGQQAARTGNYAYDQVNKALQFGIGVETEIWGLRQTCASACPELADYIGQVNRFKRRYPDLLINGTFRDTVGARVSGPVHFSVLDGPEGKRALVLRNPHKRRVSGTAVLPRAAGRDLRYWQPGQKERPVRSLPFSFILPAQSAGVLLVL